RIRSEKKRRKQFNELISELGALLPDGQSRMDKPTVLQRTLHFFSSHHELNVEQETNEPPPPWKPAFLSNDNFTQLILEAMDCFVIVVMSSGEISFVSESVTSLLGYLPSELLRQNLFDFVPEHEQAELRCLFSTRLCVGSAMAVQYNKNERHFELCCHLQRGEVDPSGDAYYIVRTCVPNSLFRLQMSSFGGPPGVPGGPPRPPPCLVASVHLLTSQFIKELSSLEEAGAEFTSRHSLEWKFLFLDHRAPPIIGYMPFEVLGTSGYDYYHVDDLESITQCHRDCELRQSKRGP
uniref:Uncharacterized protein n=1 Tax=Petromyzon marinus TaxID=7757 RepID=S4RCP4_PETMA